MSGRIKTRDASMALGEILRERAQERAGDNSLVSRSEAKGLDPFLKKSEEAIRAEAGKGARVSVDALVERAERDAQAVWEEFNPAGHGVDSTYLAVDEVKAIAAKDPALGALTELARLRAGKRGQDPAAVVRDFFGSYSFADRALHDVSLPGGQRVDARVGQPGRTEVPAEVLRVFDGYQRAEQADWASVSLHRGSIAGVDVWAVYMTTDGDESVLEVLDRGGEPLCSARLFADQLTAWDEFAGRARLSPRVLRIGPYRSEEGLSEPAERAAAGQIPQGWAGEAALSQGRLQSRDGQLTTMDLPDLASLSAEQRELAYAGLSLAFEQVLRHREDNGVVDLAANGSLHLGSFVRPDDGQTYLVADWRDIDDGSYTFYFRRGEHGLALAIEQFNN